MLLTTQKQILLDVIYRKLYYNFQVLIYSFTIAKKGYVLYVIQ